MKRLDEVLSGREGHYILPFLWMKGEGKEKIRRELDQIFGCGIRQVCVESRPHPDFLGEGWWQDLDVVMEYAREKGMKVWILDDRRFPTGYANGAFKEKPEKAKIYLAEEHVDVLGPVTEGAVLLKPLLKKPEEILGIRMYERVSPDTTELNLEKAVDLSDVYENGMVFTDIPEGMHRIQIFYTTHEGPGKENYINLMDEESVQVLIDTVYEPHYRRYCQQYGKRYRDNLAGFFSDEPELGNVEGCTFLEKTGKPGARLPWSGSLKARLQEKWKEGYPGNLAALWYECGEQTPAIRYDYMDGVSSLAGSCFSQKLGDWCRQRGLAHIGHIIEDNNAHGGLGCSMGHYFRSQRGQAMSGVDVVSLQIMPGFTGKVHQWLAAETDGEFFHFGLAKLGASEAHLNPEKEGRAFCEIFGAYGWAEGVPLMRWLTDHMLVRGINHFVPHAFSMTFPDDDCPPHFYAGGANPQYPFFAELMKYMNRMCHLLNGGSHMAEALVVYHSEAEWGTRETMAFQKPVRELLEHQMDCQVISSDSFSQVIFREKEMEINGSRYQALIFPAFHWIPENFADFALKAAEHQVPVYWMEEYPKEVGSGRTDLLLRLKETGRKVPAGGLADELSGKGLANLASSRRLPYLRTYLYRQEDGILLMVFNEDPRQMAETELSLLFMEGEEMGQVSCYLGADNRACTLKGYPEPDLPGWRTADGLHICLEPGEAACFLIEKKRPAAKTEERGAGEEILVSSRQITLEGVWTVTGREPGKEVPAFCEKIQGRDGFRNMNGPGRHPDFSGACVYETEVDLEEPAPGGRYFLEIPEIYDCAEITVNQKTAGMRCGRPYRLEVTEQLHSGRNTIMITTSSTLVWKLHDRRSARMQLMPTGIGKAPVLTIWEPEKRKDER